MSKSPDAFRTISEVAEWLGVQAHVLRFWESKFVQVKPVKRAGGRRYYRPADMLLLGGIKKLLHDDGLTIKGAQKTLRENGVDYVADMSQPLDDLTMAVLEGNVQEAARPDSDAAGPDAPEVASETSPLTDTGPTDAETDNGAPAGPAAAEDAVSQSVKVRAAGAEEPPTESRAPDDKAPATPAPEPQTSAEEPVQTPYPGAPASAPARPTAPEPDIAPSPMPVPKPDKTPDPAPEPGPDKKPDPAPEPEPDRTPEPDPAPAPDVTPGPAPESDTTPDKQDSAAPAEMQFRRRSDVVPPAAEIAAPQPAAGPSEETLSDSNAAPEEPVSEEPKQDGETAPSHDPASAADTAPAREALPLDPMTQDAPASSQPETAAEQTEDVVPSPVARKPRIVDIPPVPPAEAFEVGPSLMSALADVSSLSEAQAREIQPWLARLTRLRDSMASAIEDRHKD